MVEFDLKVLETDSGAEQLTDRILAQAVTWDLIPRIGESIDLAGSDYPVKTVRHCMLEPIPRIEVEVTASGFDFTNLIDQSGWKKVGSW